MQENVQGPEERPMVMWGLWKVLLPFLPIPLLQVMEVMEDHEPSHSVSCSADKNLICTEKKTTLFNTVFYPGIYQGFSPRTQQTQVLRTPVAMAQFCTVPE
jgi:hypothetical protein